ncbi:MAG: 30S ribosome-binding factor RbfA, partial [Acidobacteria bacterium]|nr:30S ribosome-binding factor RbfA [Acidobacteriota bacterium]
MSIRTDRVSDLMKDEISRLILRELRDPRIGFVTVTGTSVSPDLRLVRVFVSVLGDDAARQASLKALNNAAALLRALSEACRAASSPRTLTKTR